MSVTDDAGRMRHWHVANRLRREVIAGELNPGDKLDRETVLAARYGVARGTIRMAIAILRDQGVLVSRHGTGTFVAAVPRVRRVMLGPGDAVYARLPDEPEREDRALPPGVPVMVVSRADGGTEFYDASVTDMAVPSPGQVRGGHRLSGFD